LARRRVVVTGLGIVSPVGIGVESAWANIVAGKSGIAPITRFDPSAFSSQIAGEVKEFEVTRYLSAKEARRMDTFIHYGMAAAIDAIKDAGIEATPQNAERIGVNIGSGIGGLPMIEDTHVELQKGGARKISPFFAPATIINMISGNLSIMYGFKGPNLAIVTACATATHCIGESGRLIEYGDADVMIAGGAEATVSPLGVGGFCAARALSGRNDDPVTASRPWDKDRDGFVLGEGAGVLVIEEYEHARARGAKIYCELAGYGVDYINAHGTSTPLGDIAETVAVKRCFGDHAGKIAVSSTKSMTGHLLGAAGGVEGVFSVLAVRDQVAPPTINIFNQDPQCDLDYVPNAARQMKINVAISNSFGFGGTNGTLVFRRI